MDIYVKYLSIGAPKHLTLMGKAYYTGILKRPVTRALRATKTGLDGDGVGDTKHHGGADKAICVYPSEHYPHWTEVLGHPLPTPAFGENLTIEGATEAELCIGDIFEVLYTSATTPIDPLRLSGGNIMDKVEPGPIVEISQPRQPCATLAARHDRADLVKLMVNHGSTGFYVRVLEEGMLAQGATLRLVERGAQGITIAEANRLLHHDKKDREGIDRMLAEPALSASWRESFEKLKAAL